MKKNNGITLIALVITIIVLLILSGVTIVTLTGDNGLFTKTTEAEFKSEIKQYEEELRLKIGEEDIEALGNRTNTINVFKKFPSTGEENENFEKEMKSNIPSFNNSKYGNKLEIRNDELIYTDEENELERKWFGEVNLSLAKYFITVNYVDKQGNKLAESETVSTITGLYEIEPKVIEGYEAERPIYEGKIKGDTEITITYLQESGDLAYIGLDESGNETEDENKIVEYSVAGIGNFTGEDLVVPKKYKNIPVTQIEEKAFKNNNTIKNLIISNQIKLIKTEAFWNNSKIEYLKIDAQKISTYTLDNCPNITKINIGENVKNIADRAFYNCKKLSDVTIFSSEVNINAYTFAGCSAMKTIKTNKNNSKYKEKDNILYSKDGKKIYMCPSAREGEYIISSEVEEIGDYAFYGNLILTNIIIPKTVKRVGTEAFWNNSKIEYLKIDAQKISTYTLDNCPNITKIDIGENVENIADRAFYKCNNLNDVTILSNQANINAYTFADCSAMKTIKINENNNKYKVVDDVLYSKDGKKIYMCPSAREGEYIIPSEVEEIGDYAFYGNLILTNIIIPETVNVVGIEAFWNCSNLLEITLKAHTISKLAFDNCSNLKNIVIKNSVKNIKERVFNGCNKIEKINYDGSISDWNNISENEWNKNSNITQIICLDGTTDI